MFTQPLGEFKAPREQKDARLRHSTASQEEAGDGLQVVYSKKKKKKRTMTKKKEKMYMAEERVCRCSCSVTMANMEKAAASGTKEKLCCHAPSTPIPRPQEVYHIVVDNTSKPFPHAVLERSQDGSRPVHPLKIIPVEQHLFDRSVPETLALTPPELSDTPFTFVEDRKTLNKLVRKLENATEFAVNMEHNHYRSFQGLTCLMQISTRTEDFIVDTLKLRSYLGNKRLRKVFQDPTKKKVMHGADRGIIWLQRDFGIYVCNLFDTGQASRILQLGCISLEHLLRYCGVKAKKRHQRADWRRRPLPYYMIKHARESTHYLLYIYDLLRLRLLREYSGENDLFLEVLKCSNEICLQLYEKKLLTDSSYLSIHRLKENELSARQLAVLAGLYQWRDSVARALDESTSFILPDKILMEIAKQTPVTVRRLKRTMESENKFLEHHLGHVITIIRNGVANSDAFENIAEQLKKERLEKLMVPVAKSSSEDTEMITAVDADNNERKSHSSDVRAVNPGFSSKQEHVPEAPFFTRIVDGSLDYSAICATLKKVIKWMGFDQLTVLIKYGIIPFVKSSSEKLWPKLLDEVLDPIFDYFHFKLYKSWCVLLNNGSVQVPDTIAGISLSKEEADKLGSSFIIQLTRAASELLAVIASPELNGSSEFVCSRSLVGYVLDHNVLRHRVLSLVDYIFGAWKDDEAKMTMVPFCYKIIQVATATRPDEVISFVKDSIIPHLVPCFVSKSSLDSTQPDELPDDLPDDIRDLFRQAFHCVQNPNQDLSCESIDKVFKRWLRAQMCAVLCRNEPLLELEEFVWIWEVEEEFSEYIPGYIDMLHQVNEMDDCLKCDYSSPWDLFDILEPQFRSKYAIDSASHDYLWAMSAMVSRKMSAMHWQRRNDQMFTFFCVLINFKPYIQHSSYDDSVVKLVEEPEDNLDLAEFHRADALEVFCAILLLWEPQFHPLIRKEHKHLLEEIVLDLTSRENITFLQPLLPDTRDFPVHLRAYAENYINNRNKLYHTAKEQARLHEEFDARLASGVVDNLSESDAMKAALGDGSQFSFLDLELIKLSFERRTKLLDRRDQLHSFYECFQRVTNDEQLRIGLQSLIDELEGEGFFCTADDAIDWDKKCFSELMEKFSEQVFAGHHLSKYYVLRGIMDYRAMSLMNDGSCSWHDIFEEVVGKPYHRWIQNIHLFWMDTRYYKHHYYETIQQPLQKIWKKEEHDSTGVERMD